MRTTSRPTPDKPITPPKEPPTIPSPGEPGITPLDPPNIPSPKEPEHQPPPQEIPIKPDLPEQKQSSLNSIVILLIINTIPIR